jgi:ferredoxin
MSVIDKANRFSEIGQLVPLIDREVCTGCGQCVTGCPSGALGLVGAEVAVIRGELCTYCGDCEESCPEEGIALLFEVVFIDSLQHN